MRTRAFTLVELIAVITVIVILIGLVAVGFNQVEKARAATHTRTIFAAIRQPLASGKMVALLDATSTATQAGLAPLATFHGSFPSSRRKTFASITNSAAILKYLYGTDGLAELNNLGALDPARSCYLIDAWGNEIMFFMNSNNQLVLVSAGKNGKFDNPNVSNDDLYDGTP